MTNFLFFFCKLVKMTIETDRFHWLKSSDKNLKSHPKQFWKYVSQFRKKNADLLHLEINGILTNKPGDIAEASSKNFQLIYSSSYPGTSPFSNKSMEALSFASLSNLDVHSGTKRLPPIKSVGLHRIRTFGINSCSEIFVPILKFIFILAYLRILSQLVEARSYCTCF
jgi:hypothetical protein